jgi:hypothetical protein
MEASGKRYDVSLLPLATIVTMTKSYNKILLLAQMVSNPIQFSLPLLSSKSATTTILVPSLCHTLTAESGHGHRRMKWEIIYGDHAPTDLERYTTTTRTGVTIEFQSRLPVPDKSGF